MVLAFGMTVVGCGDENLDRSLFGTWVHASDGDIITFNRNGTFRWEWDRDDVESGIWITSGGILILTLTYEGRSFDEALIYYFRNGDLFIDGMGPYKKR